MSWICLIGASEAGSKAIEQLGYEIGIMTNSAAVSKVVVDRAQMIVPVDFEEMDSMRKGLELLIRALGKPVAIVGFTELALEPAAELSEEYGLPTNPLDVVVATRNKVVMREKLRDLPAVTCPYLSGSPEEIYNALQERLADDPWIIKPIDGVGSTAVYLIENHADLENWNNQQRELTKTKWIAEGFVPGVKYCVEGVTIDGEHILFGVTYSHNVGYPDFVDMGQTFPAVISEEDRLRIYECVKSVLTHLGVQMGPTHTEVKLAPNGNVFVIETHTRPGGDFIPENVERVTGYDQYTIGIQSVLGLAKASDLTEITYDGACSVQYFPTEKGTLSGIEFLGETEDLSLVRWVLQSGIGAQATGSTNTFTRLGYVMTRGATTPEAIENGQKAMNRFVFTIKNEEAV
ncbi:MAG: ATP-grasp domain-containing protein, partial [Tumebacillaceae bacterium]